MSPRVPSSRHASLLAASLMLLAAVALPSEPLPALPDVLPYEPLVKDGVFAVLLGLVESDSYGTLTSEHLGRDLTRRQVASRLPYRRLRELRRSPEEPEGTARVEVLFDGPLRLSIPYAILGYHPGTLRAEAVCVFREWRLGTLEVPSPGGPFQIQDVRAFAFREGGIRIDFDAWLDWLMGSALDDTTVSGIAIFRHRGRWIGLALGSNDKGEPRSGSFDFEQDKVLIPASEELRAAARHMRARLKALAR